MDHKQIKPRELESIARKYLDAVGSKDLDTVQSLLSPDVTFVGPVMSICGAPGVIESLQRIGAIHVRNEIKRVFVDDNEVCVIYDFVTDLVENVPTIEWLRIDGTLIQSVRLYYDQLPWQKLRQALARREAM